MLRKQLAIIYLAEAPLERRRARLHAQALLAGMAHDPSPVATEVLALGPRIRQLYVICMEADKGLSRLYRHEMEMMLALNSLEQATGRKMAGEVIFSHTGRDGVRHGRMAFEKMQRLLAPVEQMCAGSEEFRDICDQFGKHKRALGETWREKLAIDAQARALWQSLEDELLRLVNEVSSRELQRSLEEAESLSEATDYIVWSIFLFTLGLLAFLLVLLLLLRRDLLRPLVRIAGNLSRLRDGMQPEPIPAVRITELQEVVDIVPDIGGYLGSLRERSCRLEEEKDAYSRMSLMDSLTGIPNRRALDMRLAELRQAASLIMLDVDLFKIYNDTLGHQEGDACLHRVAQAMRDGLRGGDREIFRYGGEEFAVVLDGVSPEHALHVAERLRQTVEQLGIPHPGNPSGHVTISLGVAAVAVLTPETLPRLLETADSALYSAKEHGRNRVHLAGELVKKSACLAAGDRL